MKAKDKQITFFGKRSLLLRAIAIAAIALLVFGALFQPVMALNDSPFANAGFEDNLIGWIYSGAIISTGASITVDDGVWTIQPADNKMAQIEPDTTTSNAESALGLTNSQLVNVNGIANVGYIVREITLSAGESVTMHWNYVSRDYEPYDDGSFASLTGPGGHQKFVILVRTTSNGLVDATGSYGSSGWHTVTLTAGSTGGTYNIGFGCFNDQDTDYNPILFVDNAAGGTSTPDEPVVSTSAPSNIGSSSAIVGGDVSDAGSGTVTARGIVYSSSNSTPEIGGAGVTQVASGSGLGAFSESITGLTSSTQYYVRAYATNSGGFTSYGGVQSFITTSDTPPTADAGGPYSGNIGENIMLNGTGSHDSDGTITSYAWDLDNDGSYDDATGSQPTHSWSIAGTHTIGLKVTDDDSATGTDTTTVTVRGPILTFGNVIGITSDWGINFNLNHSVAVTNADASNVNVTYNVSWIIDNNTMGPIAKDGMKWHNQTLSNSTVQKITVKVDATSTTGSATNDSEIFLLNITRRNIEITSQPESTQSVGTDTTFWINASANDEHGEDLICKADLIREGVIIGNQTISGGKVNFSRIESTAGTFNFSVRFHNTSHYDNKSTSNSTVTVLGPILTLDNVNDMTRDWGKSFNLNHSVTVANAAASNVNVTYNVSWILNNNTMGTIAQGGMRWHNQTLSNSTVQNITLRVDATSTTGSAINDTGTFQLNITRRNMEITSQPKPAQTFDPDTTFWINASARDEYGDLLIGTADLIKDGTIVESQDISSGNANFSTTEPLAGTFNLSIRFYNLTHYNNASTSNSSVTVNGPTLTISNVSDITKDWGINFNLNHSVTVTNATATNVNVSYNVSWLTECTLGTVNKDATGWGNQTVSNSTVQQITVRVNANSTNTSAVNDTDTFQVNITKRDINITSHPPATQTVNPDTTFWINATVEGEYAENFIGNATLLRDEIVVGTPKAVTDGNASFNWTESSTGTYYFSIRFYNITYYLNASTDNSTVSVENPPSSGGGGSSGGGIGTSNEPENVEETVVLRIYLQAGDSSTYNFNNVVTSVEVTPERTYSLVAAKIEVLFGQPGSITTDPPAGVLFKYVNVFVGTSGWAEGKFSSSVINFQIPASWWPRSPCTDTTAMNGSPLRPQ